MATIKHITKNGIIFAISDYLLQCCSSELSPQSSSLSHSQSFGIHLPSPLWPLGQENWTSFVLHLKSKMERRIPPNINQTVITIQLEQTQVNTCDSQREFYTNESKILQSQNPKAMFTISYQYGFHLNIVLSYIKINRFLLRFNGKMITR